MKGQTAIGSVLRRIFHFVRHWFKELFIAVVLAIAAAIWVDHQNASKIREAINQNKRAVAQVLAYKNHAVLRQGSGVFINETGMLITNYHVIDGADDVIAQLPTGAYYELRAEKGSNKTADIAILQFKARETPYVHGMGDSTTIEAGQKVITIGAPLGLEASVSDGIISNPRRSVAGIDLIQFTAPISSGSSGGGLFDGDGLLLGLTSRSLALPTELREEATAQNINFAVPINLVKDSLNGVNSQLTEGSPEYYFSLGNIAENKHQWDEAITDYQQAIAIDDKYADAYVNLGGAYYEKGDYDSEVASYEKAVELDPGNYYEAQYYLGTAYEDRGEYARAIERYKAALMIKPDNKDCLRDLILLYLVEGERKAASGLITRLKTLDMGVGREFELLLQRTR